jgi:hypothetical protein
MFAKLTSTKLTSVRVPCQTHLGLRPEPMLRAPAHANDNRLTRTSGAAAIGRPVLTCRWVPSAAGGLECRWFADGEATRRDEPGGAACGERPAATGGRRLAPVAG